MYEMLRPKLKYLLPTVLAMALAACANMQSATPRKTGQAEAAHGRVVRIYENAYRETRQAGVLALGGMGVPTVDDLSDVGSTSIKAVLPDGVPVSVDIVDLGTRRTEVAVRAGRAGRWNRQAARRLQGAIAETLRALSTPAVKVQPKDRAAAAATPKETAKAVAAAPAAKKPAAPAAGKRTGPRPQFTIFFGANSDELTPAQMKTLDEVARRILETPSASVKLNGYTDSRGNPGYNRMISEARASVVKFYLVSKGVPPSRIEVKGYGARNFIADNKTLAGRKKNRRVEIVISTGLKK